MRSGETDDSTFPKSRHWNHPGWWQGECGGDAGPVIARSVAKRRQQFLCCLGWI